MATGGYPTASVKSPSVKLQKRKPKVGLVPKKKNPPLAKPKLKTQTPSKPYDPYAPLDPSVIEANAAARAKSQVQPELDTLGGIARDTAGAHATRQQELMGWYGGLQSTLDKSFDQTSSALNQLIALNNQGGVDENNILSAALRQGNQPGANAAAMMPGVSVPPSNDAQTLASSAANAANQSNFTAANAMGTLQAQGDRRQLATVGGIEANAAENRRYDASRKELGNQVMDVARRIPDLTNVARQDIQALETQKTQLGEARANRLFQQWLAEKELNLKNKNETFQEYLAQQNLGVSKGQLSLDQQKFSHQSQIDWAQIGLNQREIEARLADLKSKKGDKTSQLRAKQWDNGLSMLQSYMAPTDQEGPIGVEDPAQLIDKNGSPLQPYRRNYDDAMRILTGRARMSRSDALQVLSSSDFGSWRSRARKELYKIKAGTVSKLKPRPTSKGAPSARGTGSARITKTSPVPLKKR